MILSYFVDLLKKQTRLEVGLPAMAKLDDRCEEREKIARGRMRWMASFLIFLVTGSSSGSASH